MSKTPIKVVTDLDLSRNNILNVSKIEGNQEYEGLSNLSKNLEITTADAASSGDVVVYTGTGSARGTVKILSEKGSTYGIAVEHDSTINVTSSTNINLTGTQGINQTVGNTTLNLSSAEIKASTTNTTLTSKEALEVSAKNTTITSSEGLSLEAGEGDTGIIINTGKSKSEIQSNRLVAKGTVETPEVVVNNNLIIYWDDKSKSIVFAKKA